MWTVELIVISVMIVFNAVFAAYEIALASIGPGRLHALMEEGRRGAASALRMKQSMEASLAVVQLGITLVGVVAAATGGAGAEEAFVPVLRAWGWSPGVSQFLALAIVVAPLTLLTIILGELVPKVFALRHKEWVCLKLSPPMEWFSYSVWPAVWLLESTVKLIIRLIGRGPKSPSGEGAEESPIQELRGAAAMARMSRLIGHREEGIIVSASRLAATPLRQIMLPAEYIGMLGADQPLSEALIAAHQEMHTRFPVTEEAGNPQKIIGYVNFKDIVAALRLSPHAPSLRSLMRRIESFGEEVSVADCLENLMRNRNHIALVRDKAGRIVGMVTLEDIVEELVGEIHDEFDRMPAYLTPLGEGWIAGGFVSLNQLREQTGIDLQPLNEKPIYTLNDWIVERLGRPPRGGDVIQTENCRVLVRKTRHILVQEAFISPIQPPNASDDDTGES
jgi:putative hemolysin